MAKKDLHFFMRNTEPAVVKAPGPDTFKDENGEPIMFEIKVLTQAEIQKINNSYKKHTVATDKKGNPLVNGGEIIWKTETDSAKASRHIIAEALQYPDLKDKELMDYYHCVDITEMPLLVFPTSAEYSHVARMVMTALGLIEGADTDDSTLEEAKN